MPILTFYKLKITSYFILVTFFGLSTAPIFALESSKYHVAIKGKQALPIFVSPTATESIKKTAAELAKMLEKLSSTDVTIKVGDGSQGIVLGQAKNFT